MSLLTTHAQQGRILGIPIPGENQLLHQLFADDIDIFLDATHANFEAVAHVIHQYEKISGAHLNLEKSTIIPMGIFL